MVRLSDINDLKGIIAVWKEAFGDSEEDILFFLDNSYVADNTVVYDYNGEVASVLFLLDGDMHINGTDYSSYYLYAACTLKKYRGRGIMSEMLEFSKDISAERNKLFIALKPAEDSLYNYYGRFGYRSVFTMKNMISDIDNFSENNDITNNDNYDYSELRNNFLKNYDYFKWNGSSVDFAINHHKYYGGNIVSDNNGYLLYSINDGFIDIKENTFSYDIFYKLTMEIADRNKIKKIKANLPFGFQTAHGKSEIRKSGMLLPVSPEADKLIESVNNAYLSLTLD